MKRFVYLFIIFVFIFYPNIKKAVCGEKEDIAAMRAELTALRKDIAYMKKYYESKIKNLETQITQTAQMSLPERGPCMNSIEKPSPNYSYSSSVMNPDISVVVDAKQRFNDDAGDENRDKLTVGEAELNIKGVIYPNVEGNVTAAIETEYSDETHTETETDLEEAYISFLSLPFGTQLQAGRRFIDFGLLNPVHSHEWAFTDTPLIYETLFGHHNWYDDGLQGSILIPNPWDIYCIAKFGVNNGRDIGHHHDHDEDEETEPLRRYNIDHDELVSWGDMVYNTRVYANVPVGDNADAGFGYSAAWEEHPMTVLHGLDFTFTYRWIEKYRWIKWQNEYIYAELQNPDRTPQGAYSMLEYSINKNWRIGTRWDISEYNENERFSQWANSYFLTYLFNEHLYLRATYRYRDFADMPDMHQEAENTIWFQLVWGLGPHSHGISE